MQFTKLALIKPIRPGRSENLCQNLPQNVSRQHPAIKQALLKSEQSRSKIPASYIGTVELIPFDEWMSVGTGNGMSYKDIEPYILRRIRETTELKPKLSTRNFFERNVASLSSKTL